MPLHEALPRSFDFYHLGRIELAERAHGFAERVDGLAARDARGSFGIAYRLEGELRGVLLLLVPQGLDASTYSEAGNIMVSRLATELAARHGVEAGVSPPRVLTAAQLRTFLEIGGHEARYQTYVHRQGSPEHLSVTLQAVLMPASSAFEVHLETPGHA